MGLLMAGEPTKSQVLGAIIFYLIFFFNSTGCSRAKIAALNQNGLLPVLFGGVTSGEDFFFMGLLMIEM